MSSVQETIKMSHYACVFHLPKDEVDTLVEIIEEYDIGEYLLGYEAEPFSHFHVIMELPDKKQWTAFQKKIIEKYNLRGKASKGKARQYGALKKINDIEKLKSYTVKEGNVRTNMSEADFQKYLSSSFIKQSNRAFFDSLMIHLDTLDKMMVLETVMVKSYLSTSWEVETDYYPKIYKEIIGYCLDKEYKVSPSQIKSWAYSYIQKSTKFDRPKKISVLMEKIR